MAKDFYEAVSSLNRMTEPQLVRLFTLAGIKAVPESGCQCPIAQWITARTSEPVVVGAEQVCLKLMYDDVYADLSEPAREFIRRFDEGEYLDLIADEYVDMYRGRNEPAVGYGEFNYGMVVYYNDDLL